MPALNASVECFNNQIPAFAATELQRLYHNLYASLPHMRNAGKLDGAVSTYVRRIAGEAVTVLLFRRCGAQIHVVNELISLDTDAIDGFVDYVFHTFDDVHLVRFHALDISSDTVRRRSAHRYQQINRSEDIVLPLPTPTAAYQALLGKSTRSYINRYLNKLQRTFPSFRRTVYEPRQITEQLVSALVGLHHARMSSKHKVSSTDLEKTRRLTSLARELGFVAVMTIDGRICGGTVNFRVGDDYFMEVIAHDPAYDHFRLGTLCCYLTICQCIERHGAAYHFLWGRYDYKYRLRGVQHDLYDVLVYRSWQQLLLHGHLATAHAVAGYARPSRLWLEVKARQKEGWASQCAANILSLMRKTRHGMRLCLPTRNGPHPAPPSVRRQPSGPVEPDA